MMHVNVNHEWNILPYQSLKSFVGFILDLPPLDLSSWKRGFVEVACMYKAEWTGIRLPYQ